MLKPLLVFWLYIHVYTHVFRKKKEKERNHQKKRSLCISVSCWLSYPTHQYPDYIHVYICTRKQFNTKQQNKWMHLSTFLVIWIDTLVFWLLMCMNPRLKCSQQYEAWIVHAYYTNNGYIMFQAYVYGDAWSTEVEQQYDHQYDAWSIPRRSQNTRRIP